MNTKAYERTASYEYEIEIKSQGERYEGKWRNGHNEGYGVSQRGIFLEYKGNGKMTTGML